MSPVTARVSVFAASGACGCSPLVLLYPVALFLLCTHESSCSSRVIFVVVVVSRSNRDFFR